MKLKISYEMSGGCNSRYKRRYSLSKLLSFTYSFIEEKLINRERKEKMG